MRPERTEPRIDGTGVAHSADAQVDFGAGFCRNDIGPRASLDHARIHRQARIEVRKSRDGDDLPGEFQHSAGAGREINA